MSEAAARLAIGALIVLAVAVTLANLSRPLANPDEARYAEISREMADGGDWVTPRLNGIRYFEKPPLQYWATALAFKVNGPVDFAARLYVAFCGFGVLLLIGFTASRLMGQGTSSFAQLALLACPYFVAMMGIATLDMGLAFWTTAALCALILANVELVDARQRRKWLLVAWAATALAVLSKGLVALVFPAAAVALHAVIARDASLLRRLEWVRGSALFLAIAAPWFVAVSIANPDFASFFFVHEHFGRFLSGAHGRSEPWWYLLAVTALAFLPWVFALPAAAIDAWRAEREDAGFRPFTFALAWGVFVIAFFSASSSKLPGYILPAVPALALVLGRYLADAPERRLAALLAATVPLVLALGVAAWLAPSNARDAWVQSLYLQAQPWMLGGLGALLAGIAAGAWLLFNDHRRAGVAAVAFGSLLCVACGLGAFDAFEARQSGREIALKMRPFVAPQARVYSVKIYDQGVPFYLRRTVTLVDYRDEFDTGLRVEPGLALPDLATFMADWARPGQALAIMHPDIYQQLRAQGLTARLVHEDPRRVLVRKL